MKIYKYQLDYTEKQTIKAKILKPLSVQMQDKKMCLWAIVDENDPQSESIIHMYGTGTEIDPTVQLTYISTLQIEASISTLQIGASISTLQIGAFVFHCFAEGIYH